MRLSNSKKELARIISENGGWRGGARFAVQDNRGSSKNVWFSFFKPTRGIGSDGWRLNGGKVGGCVPCSELITNWHQTILFREEYFHLHPEPDADGWIEWGGGPKSPVDKGTLVDVKMKGGEFYKAQLLDDENWSHSWGDVNIVAYRLHKQEQAKPEFCESVTRSIPKPEAKPTIEQLAADYRNRKDYADRKQREADAAKAEADAKLAELVAAGREIGLFLSVEITHVYSGKFYNAELGESPEYIETNNNSICEGCGKRLGQHYELASYCLSRTDRERVGLLTL